MKTPIIYISIVASALVVGAAGGFVAKKTLGGEDISYDSNSDIDSIKVDSKQLLRNYQSYGGNAPEKDFSAMEIVNIALEKYRQCEYSYSYGIGSAKTIVSQEIRNYQIRNGNEYFEESISYSSMVKLADRMTQTGLDGDVTVYYGKASGAESGTYPIEGNVYTQEDYSNLLGRTLDEMFIYIISNKTVLESEVNRVNEQILVKLSLDPVWSTYHYKYQMKNISNLDSLPKFNYVNLTYTLSSDLSLIYLDVDESYEASMGITVSITNGIHYEYFPNQKLEIPSINEALNYSLKGEDVNE